MKFKFTILLLLANFTVFFAIWFLERKPADANLSGQNFVDFTVLEIEGKNIDKPRILKLENNRWRIVSPIDWSANVFAVNRIKNQLEFLDKESSFLVSEIERTGNTLASYGLDDPALTFRYGDGKKMRELKVGKTTAGGSKIYVLDAALQKIITVDKTLIENFVMDIDSLRGQSVFEIPRFEVSGFSIRLAQEGAAMGSSNLRRIGLVKDGAIDWKFETPISARADTHEVSSFLDDLCTIAAKKFAPANVANAGLDMSSFQTAITIQGTNRKQTLILGNLFEQDQSLRYARLEENPTIFLVDAAMFKDLGKLQKALRDKAFLKFDELELLEIDIASRDSEVKLKKLGSGDWEAIGKNAAGVIETAPADYAIVNSIIYSLKGLRARDFVTDAPGDNARRYGFNEPAFKITLKQSGDKTQILLLGARYNSPSDGELLYVSFANEDPVYGVAPTILFRLPSDLISAKSKTFNVLPEKAVVEKYSLFDIEENKVLFEIDCSLGEKSKPFTELPQKRRIAAFRILESIKKFSVLRYLDESFSPNGAMIAGEVFPWKYKLSAEIKMPGTGGDKMETRTWYFTKRISGSMQFGGSELSKVSYEITQQLIDSIFELTLESNVPASLNLSAPKPLTEIPLPEGAAQDVKRSLQTP